MNKIYKTVWSAKKGTYVAVSEIVTNRGKEAGGSEGASTSKPSGRLKTLASILLSIGFASGLSYQAVAQEANTADIETVLGTTYNGSSFVIPPNGIGGTNQSNVFGAIGKVQGDLTSLTGRVTTTESNIIALTSTVGNASSGLVADVATNTSNISTNTSNISANTGNINANTGNINALQTAVGVPAAGGKSATGLFKDVADLNTGLATTNKAHTDFVTHLDVDTTKDYNGIKYFRANSTKDDAVATGTDSVAIGPEALAAGDNSVAIGDAASTIGGAKSKGSIALGNKAEIVVDVNDDDSDATGAIAIGQEATSSATSAIALGQSTAASGASSVAIGDTSKASGASSVALGDGAQALAQENISIGRAAGVGTINEVANDRIQNIAIGSQAGQNVKGYGNVALGYQAGGDVSGNNNIAFGSNAGDGLTNDDNISIGRDSNEPGNGWRVIAIGAESNAKETASVALGYKSSAHGTLTLALGASSVATEGGSVALGTFSSAESGHIAIGQYSSVTAADAAGVGDFGGRSADGAVSVGTAAREVTDLDTGSTYQQAAINRRIVNVADGKEDSDAATVAQLRALAAGLPNIDYEDLVGRVTKNLGSTFDDIQHHYVSINDGGTVKSNYHNTGAKQLDSIAIGPTALANAERATVLGSDLTAFSTAQNSVVVGTSISAEGKNSVTIGNTNTLTEDESGIAIGTSVTSRGENSIVIGRGSEVDYQGVVGETIENSRSL